jgi:hypothetical protein
MFSVQNPPTQVESATLDKIPVPTQISAYRIVNSRRRLTPKKKMTRLIALLTNDPDGLPADQATRVAAYLLGL